MKQYRTWLVCQFCGRVAPSTDAPHWLNQPSKLSLDIRIVRCPEHWSEWALRHTRDGRTNANRAAMQEALDQPAPLMPPSTQPFPMTERDNPAVNRVRT